MLSPGYITAPSGPDIETRESRGENQSQRNKGPDDPSFIHIDATTSKSLSLVCVGSMCLSASERSKGSLSRRCRLVGLEGLNKLHTAKLEIFILSVKYIRLSFSGLVGSSE